MVDQQLLGRVLKDAVKTGKYTLGSKEVLSEVKSSKVVITASGLAGKEGETIRSEAKKNNVPVVLLQRNSMQLGRMLGRPYRVSAIAIRSISESDLRQLQA